MHRRTRFTRTFLAGLVLFVPSLAAAQAPAGRLLASQCAQCHGTDGNSLSDLETLSGESAKDMLNELLDMKYSNDVGDIMIKQAKGYTDAQLRLIAEYFAAQPRLGEGDGGGDEDDDD